MAHASEKIALFWKFITHGVLVFLESVFLPIAPPCCLDLIFKDVVGSSSADIGRLLEASIGAVAIPEGITFEVRSQLRLVRSGSSSIFNESKPLKNQKIILHHSLEIRSFYCFLMLQNLPYFLYTKTQSYFFRFSFLPTLFFPLMNALVYVDIDQGIH